DALRLSRGTGRVKPERRVFRFHPLRLAGARRSRDQFPPRARARQAALALDYECAVLRELCSQVRACQHEPVLDDRDPYLAVAAHMTILGIRQPGVEPD